MKIKPEIMIVSARPLTVFDVAYWRVEGPRRGSRMIVIRPDPPDQAKSDAMMALAERWQECWE